MQSAKNYSYESYNNAYISYFTDSFVDKTGINNLIRASLTGDANPNVLSGSDGDDTLYGDAGNDALHGGVGADTLVGGKGDDILDGGTETKSGDSASYFDAISAVIVNLSTGTATGGAGNDTLISIENIIGSSYTDTLTGDANPNLLSGYDGDDTLYGGVDNDTLYGDAGNDVLHGGADDDVLSGGKGDDILDGGAETKNGGDSASYNFATSAVIVNLSTGTATGGEGNDTLISIENITGSPYADTLTGDANPNALSGWGGDDTLYGGVGNDSLYGGEGNDLLVGGVGDDTLDGGNESKGGTGLDTASYLTAASAVTVSLSLGTATGGAGNDTLINIENILGSAYADTLTGDANPNMLDGGAGADSLKGGAGDDSYMVDNASDILAEKLNEGADQVSSSVTYTLSANVENLTLTGSSSINGTGNSLANSITGNTADNVLNGGAGADSLIGGLGNDTYTVDNAGDVISENMSEGTDKVNSSMAYTLSANIENLTLTGQQAINGTGNDLANVITGNAAINVLTGGDGNDTLNGFAGADTLIGGLGNDSYVVDDVGDVITENLGEGTDKVSSSVTYTLSANVENLFLTGASVINGTGNNLANTLIGNTAANVLNGGSGNDNLDGGTGNNTLTGGAGKDIFKLTTAGHMDKITDFVVVDDTIQLENAIYVALRFPLFFVFQWVNSFMLSVLSAVE